MNLCRLNLLSSTMILHPRWQWGAITDMLLDLSRFCYSELQIRFPSACRPPLSLIKSNSISLYTNICTKLNRFVDKIGTDHIVNQSEMIGNNCTIRGIAHSVNRIRHQSIQRWSVGIKVYDTCGKCWNLVIKSCVRVEEPEQLVFEILIEIHSWISIVN